ncbi:MAG: Sec-independent protein translocase protein TatB [Pseudomonadota bacterium]
MFDIGAAELLVIIIVAVLVIGPKDMPGAMRSAGRWIGKVRKVSSHFRTGIDAMVREAELEDMEKKWKAQNEEIMKRSAASAEAAAGAPVMTGPPPASDPVDPDGTSNSSTGSAGGASTAAQPAKPVAATMPVPAPEPAPTAAPTSSPKPASPTDPAGE